jgi:hypothetical protein
MRQPIALSNVLTSRLLLLALLFFVRPAVQHTLI